MVTGDWSPVLAVGCWSLVSLSYFFVQIPGALFRHQAAGWKNQVAVASGHWIGHWIGCWSTEFRYGFAASRFVSPVVRSRFGRLPQFDLCATKGAFLTIFEPC